jgi:hypothetical protein
MQYHSDNTIYICWWEQKNPVSLMGICVLYRRDLDVGPAVFPEDQSVPESALIVLWKLDEIANRDCMTRLVARSLATWATVPDPKIEEPTGAS